MKLYLVGGFLGSGKTTAITTACKTLLKKKIRVAIITNDQGSQLVDTAFVDSLNILNREIKNGCFCCNYEQFHSAIRNIIASAHPEIIFAEAVGSCADLVATIVKPILQYEPGIETVLSVFADGQLLLSSLEGCSSFISENVRYIYKKQLEEATILIVNKSDTLSKDEINKIKLMFESGYPGKQVLFQDSRDETSVLQWLENLNKKNPHVTSRSLDIDYEKYADGEAALAWLDAFITIHSKGRAVQKCFEFINDLSDAISYDHLTIGHLKSFLKSGDWQQKISFTNNERMNKENWNNMIADHATVLVNERVETNPDQLKRIFFQAIKKREDLNCHIEINNLDSFQPGYPKPTYRFSE
ncbi:MAG: GTP-binding protein [Chitinophagales bacterium]